MRMSQSDGSSSVRPSRNQSFAGRSPNGDRSSRQGCSCPTPAPFGPSGTDTKPAPRSRSKACSPNETVQMLRSRNGYRRRHARRISDRALCDAAAQSKILTRRGSERSDRYCCWTRYPSSSRPQGTETGQRFRQIAGKQFQKRFIFSLSPHPLAIAFLKIREKWSVSSLYIGRHHDGTGQELVAITHLTYIFRRLSP